MTRPDPRGTTASRLARASEALSVLAYELAIALGGREEPASSGHGGELQGSMIPILDSVSERLSSQALDIAELALSVAEDDIAGSGDPRADRSAAVLGRITRIVEPVFAIAEELAAHLLTRTRAARAADLPLRSADLVALDAPIQELISANQSLVTGAGVAMWPGVLADRELWLQWWTNSGTTLTQLRPQLDLSQSGFYDYRSAIWFVEPTRDRAPHLAPPHFDEGGTDAFMVTASVPTVADDELIGIACAELTLERLAELVSPALRSLGCPAALVTPDLTVVVSTHPELQPAQRVPATMVGDAGVLEQSPFAELGPGLTIAESPKLAWWLLVDWLETDFRDQ